LVAFHDAKIDSTSREIDLKRVQMEAAGNVLDLITDQESLDRWRTRLQPLISQVWPNQRISATWDPRVFAELRALGKTSAEKQTQFQIDILREKSTAAVAKEKRLAREAQQELPARIKSLSTGVKNILSGEGGLTPPFATDAQIAVAVEKDNAQTLREMGERARLLIEGRPLPAATQKSLGQVGDLRRLLRVMKDNFEPGFTGFIKGPQQRLVAKFTGKITEKGIRFQQALALAEEIWSRAQSGAAIAGSEITKFRQQVPTAGDVGNVFLGKLEGLDDFLVNRERVITRLGTLTVGEARKLTEQGISPIPEPRQGGGGGQTVDLDALQGSGTAATGTAPVVKRFRRVR